MWKGVVGATLSLAGGFQSGGSFSKFFLVECDSRGARRE